MKEFEFDGKTYYGVHYDDLTIVGGGKKHCVTFKDVKDRIKVFKLLQPSRLSFSLEDGWDENLPGWRKNEGPYKYFHRNNARIIAAMQGYYDTIDEAGITRKVLSYTQASNGKSRTSSSAIPEIEDS